MRIVLNYRCRNERLEEALQELGYSTVYNLWGIDEILAKETLAVVFEFKQILKNELHFLNLSFKLKKAGIPRVTWSLDIPNIGAKRWKLPAILKLGLVDILATHSIQGLSSSKVKILYLPNAAWLSKYNMGNTTMDDLRKPTFYEIDVSFIGNIDSKKYPEHQQRTEFLNSLGRLLEKEKITYRFVDSRFLDFDSQRELIQRSRINITTRCAADMDNLRSWGLPERCYGIPACGGFLLCDERVHARHDFIEDEEIVLYKDLDDCFQKIIYYLKNHDERRMIAEKAYKRVLNEHTYKHRAEKLIKTIESLN